MRAITFEYNKKTKCIKHKKTGKKYDLYPEAEDFLFINKIYKFKVSDEPLKDSLVLKYGRVSVFYVGILYFHNDFRVPLCMSKLISIFKCIPEKLYIKKLN